MKIPEIIRIGGVDYSVRNDEHLNDGENVCYGHIDFEKSAIRLHSGNQCHQHKCQTLLHELLHGIAHHANLEIEDEEKVIDTLSKGLYQVLQDNAAKLFDLKENGR